MIDHVKPNCLFEVSDKKEVKETFNWKITQPLLKKDNQHKGMNFNLLDYHIQFIRAYQFIRLNDQGFF